VIRLTFQPPLLAAVQFVPTFFELGGADIAPKIEASELLDLMQRNFAEVGALNRR